MSDREELEALRRMAELEAKAAGEAYTTPRNPDLGAAWKKEGTDMLDSAGHLVKLAGSAVGRGVAGALLGGANAGVSPEAVVASQGRMTEDQLRQSQRPGIVGEAIERQGTQPRPESTLDRYVNAAGQAVGGAALPPYAGSAAKTAIPAVMGGLAAQGATEAGGGPLASAGAGMLGAVLTHAPMGAYGTPRLVKATQQAVKSLPEGEIEAAMARALQAGKTLGTPVMMPQAIGVNQPFSALMQELAQNPATGPQVTRMLNRQLPAAVELGQRKLGEVYPTRPGQAEANLTRDAAVRELSERPLEKAGAISSDKFRAGTRETLPASVRYSAPAGVEAAKDEMRVLDKSGAGRGFSQALARMTEASPILDPTTGKGFTKLSGDATELYNFRKELQKSAQAGSKEGASAADVTKGVGYSKMAGELKDLLQENAPETMEANSRFARSMRVNAEPAQKSPLAKMVPKGTDTPPAGDWKQLGVVFNDPASYSPADVKKVASYLNRSNPKAFPALLRQHMESRLEGLKEQAGGRLNPNVGQQYSEALFGAANTPGRENIMAGLEAVAKQQGKDPKAVRAGTENVINALDMVGNDRTGLGRLDQLETRNEAQTAASRILQGFLYRTGQALSLHNREKMYKDVLEALTAPDAAERLQRVASFSLAGNRLRALTKSAQAGMAATRGQESGGEQE